MDANQIVSQLNGKAGQHVKVTWSRPAKTLKDCALAIGKRTSAWVRSGIEFANLASVKDGVESGERESVGKLPWGQWREGFRPYIIDHKGAEYVRLYPSTFANLGAEVEWTIGGQPASYAEVEPYLLASEKRKEEKEAVECFTLKAESIVSIGN